MWTFDAHLSSPHPILSMPSPPHEVHYKSIIAVVRPSTILFFSNLIQICKNILLFLHSKYIQNIVTYHLTPVPWCEHHHLPLGLLQEPAADFSASTYLPALRV